MISNVNPSIVVIKNKRIIYFESKEVEKDCIASVNIYPGKDCVDVCSFFVKEEFRRQGIATRILKYIIKNTNLPIKLWVIWNNKAAQNLYLKCGFKYVKDTNFSKYAWQMIYENTGVV